ncbi:ABC transporter substrate-binding protein [Xanthobacter versatilis]|uniref:ABC transporter substrate-binding protein n=1 Tax=Xanthobacter autotrophicus (strain ATCC BAA-1158 / Py2) TaxID=78245 RepID=UPI003728CB4E
MNRRELLLAASALPLLGMGGVTSRALAQGTAELAIGVIYPMSGPSAQAGVDAGHASETAAEIINNAFDFDLITAADAGLPGLGGVKVKLIFADHQGDPQKGRAEAERLITQDKVVALAGCYYSSVTATVSAVAERYKIPFLCADSSSPSLQRKKQKYFFRPAAHDEMFSAAMFNFLDAQRKKGHKIETLALIYEDTVFGVDSATIQRKLAGERGYKVATEVKYRASSPSLTAEVQQLKSADPDVLMPSTYTTDAILLVKTMAELGYRPKNIVAQAAGFSEQVTFDAVGDKLVGAISRASFSLDLAAKRPFIGKVNDMFKTRAGRDLNDNTSRELMGLLVLADAINRAKSTNGDQIREALAATDIPGTRTIMPWPRITFDAEGQNPDAYPVLLQYDGERLITVFPADVAVAPPIWPMNR